MSDKDKGDTLKMRVSSEIQGGSRSPSKKSNGNFEFKTASISNLNKQRGILKARLTSFEKYISKFDNIPLDKTLKIELNLRISTLESVYKDFDDIQSKIEQLTDDDDLSNQITYRENFDEQYYGCIAVAKSLVVDDSHSCDSHLHRNREGSQIKLPDLKLVSFEGFYDQWLEFKNSYCTMIHKRTDLDPIQKFHYLRSSLSGSALQVISALEFTAENYTHAWELLLNRFQNDRLLVHNHVKSLFCMPSINKESPSQIRKLIDCILRNLRALKTLDEPTESWDTLIMYLIVSKLDPCTEREWENYKGSLISNIRNDDCNKRKLKLDDLLTFLKNRADLLE
ncbi:uncharacterized protein LOC131842208 [Achroia grisella]|uniref:uncharacterized protein LOC131842208 n=1 Tax=Achroia grisella TaxID=688607 RepID=UPI0027D26D89|nr:uncharacterized protein LOC131842208 [Achroia grisella]